MGKKSIIITEQQLGDLITKFIGGLFGGNTKDDDTSGKDDNKDENISYGKSSSISGDFNSIIDKIIDNFEGGYYDPVTMKSSAMGESGETMYGMDAKASDMLKKDAGRKFWDLIHADKAKNPRCWTLEYDPAKSSKCPNPTLANQLKGLVAQIMKPEYDNLSKRYLSPEALTIVNNDPGLLFHFTYATWNGSGFFQKFAKIINDKVSSGVKDPKELLKIAMDSRKNFTAYNSFANNLTQRGGRQMEKVLGVA